MDSSDKNNAENKVKSKKINKIYFAIVSCVIVACLVFWIFYLLNNSNNSTKIAKEKKARVESTVDEWTPEKKLANEEKRIQKEDEKAKKEDELWAKNEKEIVGVSKSFLENSLAPFYPKKITGIAPDDKILKEFLEIRNITQLEYLKEIGITSPDIIKECKVSDFKVNYWDIKGDKAKLNVQITYDYTLKGNGDIQKASMPLDYRLDLIRKNKTWYVKCYELEFNDLASINKLDRSDLTRLNELVEKDYKEAKEILDSARKQHTGR